MDFFVFFVADTDSGRAAPQQSAAGRQQAAGDRESQFIAAMYESPDCMIAFGLLTAGVQAFMLGPMLRPAYRPEIVTNSD